MHLLDGCASLRAGDGIGYDVAALNMKSEKKAKKCRTHLGGGKWKGRSGWTAGVWEDAAQEHPSSPIRVLLR